jgi:hypothetical protein
MLAKFEAMTHEKLEDFIAKADWHGKRDGQQALDMISEKRDAADRSLEQMTPAARAAMAAQANSWAEQVLAVTRTDGANDDENAQKIARVRGPRTPAEIELIRAAIRHNTNGDHSIYEELDKSLSKGNEDEAVAGLAGNPVYAATIGLANAGDDADRIKEILLASTPHSSRSSTRHICRSAPTGRSRRSCRARIAKRSSSSSPAIAQVPMVSTWRTCS